MRAIDIILKKRGFRSIPPVELSRDEIEYFISEYVAGTIPDYQVSALLMAIYFNGMSATETAYLTDSMLHSGSYFDLSEFGSICVDKHSTGGVGDKISIPLAPIVASCGVKVPMMSGRALGTTGGTLDKLDSITGYRTTLTAPEFKAFIAENNYAMTGQTETVVPADKLLYALRDVTGTVESVPLITSSILSKKIAEGSDALVFDVKCGSGAFMKNEAEATELAESLVATGSKMGKKIIALITDMNQPLGNKVGNFLEIEESIAILQGRGPKDVTELTLQLASWMLVLGEAAATQEAGYKMASDAIQSGSGLKCFYKNVEQQGGNVQKLQADINTRRSPHTLRIKATGSGYVAGIDASLVGQAGVYLGVGRNKTTDSVCAEAGVILHKKCGDPVSVGDVLMDVYGKNAESIRIAQPLLEKAVTYSEQPVQQQKQIIKVIKNSPI